MSTSRCLPWELFVVTCIVVVITACHAQACINAAGSGGTLALPAGTFSIGTQLVIPHTITVTTAGRQSATSCWQVSPPLSPFLRLPALCC